MERAVIEKRAVKAGVKASKKRHHLVDGEELLSLRIQVLPALPRILLVVAGSLLVTACFLAWPSDNFAVRALEFVSGLFLILFGIFGIRRTLANVLDACDAGDLIGGILETIADAVSSIDL